MNKEPTELMNEFLDELKAASIKFETRLSASELAAIAGQFAGCHAAFMAADLNLSPSEAMMAVSENLSRGFATGVLIMGELQAAEAQKANLTREGGKVQ